MPTTKRITTEEAKRVGDEIGVDWGRFDLEQLRNGMDVELEHGSHDPQTDVTGDDPIVTGKIALAHMKEYADYYERLERMEATAERETRSRPGDYVEIVGHRVGDAPRNGEILEVLGGEAHPHFRVRWEDGHVSMLFPGADIVVRHQRRHP